METNETLFRLGPGWRSDPLDRGTEWRAHVLIDPGTGGFRAVELTDARGGEGYGRYRVSAQEVILGDRAYATARGLWAIQSAKAYVVVRMNPHTIRVCDETGKRISLRSKEMGVPKVGGVEFNILIPALPEKTTKSHKSWPLARAIAWIPARAVAARTRLGEVIWLLTALSADQASPHELMQLYRLRWQIELFFKRLKSLLHLDVLPSRQGPTAKSWMLARFLAAALAQELVRPAGPLSPPGGMNCCRPGYTHSAWSRFRMSLWALRAAVLGKGAWQDQPAKSGRHMLPLTSSVGRDFMSPLTQRFRSWS
ncbi:MAG TPA: transposase [Terriglobia bacterium]|nr:transposase [Terriglobia bacterium]